METTVEILTSAKRILVLGPPGAGKSFLSQKLARQKNIPYIGLDLWYWKDQWGPTPPEIFKSVCEDLVQKSEWVMDGNFGATFDIRWARADAVIYLQPHLGLCLFRQLWRSLWNKKDFSRPKEMRERFNLELFWFTKKFEGAHGKLIMTKMREKYPQLPVFKVRGAEDILKLFS